MTKSRAILVDLDGCLADDSHRKHFVDPTFHKDEYKECLYQWDDPSAGTEWRHKDTYKLFQPDWDAYFAAMGDDKPNEAIVDLLIRYMEDYRCQMPSVSLHIEFEPAKILFVTGRPERYRNITLQWIEHCFAPKGIFTEDPLLMRPDFLRLAELPKTFTAPDGKIYQCEYAPEWKTSIARQYDHRPSHIVKREIYEREIRDKYEVLFVLEDNEDCCQMYRSLGLTVLRVMP
jgi:hypothetical protein